MPDTLEHDKLRDDDRGESAPRDLRELVRLHPRLLLASGLVALVMLPVGAFLAALGVWVLDVSGGAAKDTSIVVGIAGVLVTEFWGGGLVATLTKVRAAQVAGAWGIVRLVALVLVALVAPGLWPVVPIQLALAIPAAYAGARIARKQASLRRQIQLERGA